MVQLNRDALIREAVIQSAQATGVMDAEGRLTDRVAEARVARRPNDPVTVRGMPIRDLVNLRSIPEDHLRRNWEAERNAARAQGSTDPRGDTPRRAHPDYAEEAASGDDFTPPAEWLWARSIPQGEIDAALAIATPHDITGGGDALRDTLLLALVARVSRLEARIAELARD